MYRVQPFRWHYAGARWRYGQSVPRDEGPDFPGERAIGHWISTGNTAGQGIDGSDPENQMVIGCMGQLRPFINTQCYPELPTGADPDFFYQYAARPRHSRSALLHDAPCDIGNTGAVASGFGTTGQDVKWWWADPCNVRDEQKIFQHHQHQSRTTRCGSTAIFRRTERTPSSMNLRFPPKSVCWGLSLRARLGRTIAPSRSRRRAATICRRIRKCRHFAQRPERLPVLHVPQSLLQSPEKATTRTPAPKKFSIVRVSWTVFTPRFMHENKTPSTPRVENFTRDLMNQQKLKVNFKGPFDYLKYNDDNDTSVYSASIVPRRTNPPFQSQASKGVEVEHLLDEAVHALRPARRPTPIRTS